MKINKLCKTVFLTLATISVSFASSSGGDPLSDFLTSFTKWMTGIGVAFVLVSFVGVCIVIAVADEKVSWLKKLAWILAAGAMMVGASQFLTLFNISGAIF
jgi:type IV secretory pathway VirB2 component (pilin)